MNFPLFDKSLADLQMSTKLIIDTADSMKMTRFTVLFAGISREVSAANYKPITSFASDEKKF